MFDGSRTSNDVQFVMNCSVLNDTKTHEMRLEKDEIIDVAIESLSGRVDIIVEDSEGNEIYRGNDADSGKFQLIITETSTYKFTVTGRDAKGSVSFKVVSKNN